ncbi:unnamed protein product [Acanthoscelides obtectus]|uniref:Uncharacterized protein n=1 Tax=Acanthoscelides obtectus TaxID=200917 RepID=A0A9P0L7K6_ACAOB|nr:unnamed protein product [Acanthoscelides obtectus]CAK1662449.1 hypothetical protein AOBTE_LOCUS23149 [Acanthoscelides obtectus]
MAHRMDELKQKLLGLINKQPPKIPSMGFNDANYHFSQVPTLSINSKTTPEVDRPADQDILEGIEAAYFSMRDDFDICRFELEDCIPLCIFTVNMDCFLQRVLKAGAQRYLYLPAYYTGFSSPTFNNTRQFYHLPN